MRHVTRILLLAWAMLLAFSGNALADTPPRYKRAVHDAAVVEAREIAKDLVPVTPANDSLVWWDGDRTWVKVVTWKSLTSYENYILPYASTSDSEDYVIWVTMAPRIQDTCRKYRTTHPLADKAALDLRLKQRLGLHPDWQYDLFVELWVPREDLIRPCVDPDPSDTTCNLGFGNEVPIVKNIHDYAAFYKNLYYKSFRSAPGTPWTGLGYTYDWSNLQAVEGESEFILLPGTPYVIEQAVPSWEYCAPGR